MKSKTFLILALVVLMVFGPLTVFAQGDDAITLVPFTNEAFGLQGLVPEGWSEAAPGVYARGASATDATSLIMQAAPGMDAAALSGILLGQLGISELPEPSGELDAAFAWILYEVPLSVGGMDLFLDLALADSDSGAVIVLLQELAEDRDALFEPVFMAAVDALAPIGSDTEPVGAEEEPTEESAADDIPLVTFTNDTFGLQGLVPEGWDEVVPGIYARGTSAADITSLIIQSAPGMDVEALSNILLGQLGIDALPEPSNEIETDAFAWAVYEIPVSASGMELFIDLAMAEGDAGAVLVMLQATVDTRDSMVGSAFITAVEALAPYAAEESSDEETAELPYTAEDVTFASTAEDVTLAGTLTLPEGDGPFPAVITISGSGPSDRNESLAPVALIRPFELVADALTREGIAVLRYDDRGVGESTGDHMTANSLDFADDAAGAVAYLLSRPEINAEAIGLLGHSEGGMIAPIVAAGSDDVAFVISLAGPGVNGADILREQNRLIMEAAGESEETIAAQVAMLDELIPLLVDDGDVEGTEALLLATTLRQLGALSEDELAEAGITDLEAFAAAQVAAQMPMYEYWFPFFFSFDPAEAWADVDVPVLGIFGSLDLQVPANQSVGPFEESLTHNEDVTVIVIENANHLFQDAVTGSPEEYGELGDQFTPELMPTIIEWVQARFE